MNTLLIEKQTGGYFKFTLNGDTANAITSINNDLLAVGNQLHFKTGNGANIIKEQFIYPADVTIVSGGTFTFTTVAQVWDKLIAIDYFTWLGGGGTGGVDRFDDLLDTFSYTGNAGKAVVVDNSELKLVPITLYNKRLFTELEDTPSDLVPNKMLVVNPAGTAVVLQDQPSGSEEFLNSVGYFDYNDLATQTTPLSAVANVALKLTNDTEGANTSTDQNPYGVSYVWDYTTNQFNFSELEVGDTIDVRVHVQITTTTSNQKVSLKARFGIGSVSQFENAIYETTFKSSGLHEISFVAPFYMGSTYITDYPAELYLTTDASATVKVDGWYVRILRKNINIVTVDYQVPDASTTVKGIVRLAGDLGGTANNPTVPELANKVPTSRTITINGFGYDLTSNINFTIAPGTWGQITGALSNQTDLQQTLNTKEGTISGGTTSQYWRGDKSWQNLNSSVVGLGNVDNTTDLNKPISIAAQTALDAKVPTSRTITINGFGYDLSSNVDFTINPGVWGSITGTLSNQTDLQQTLNTKEGTISGGTTSQYWRGDKSWQNLNSSAVGLGNVNNTSDANKPISTATQTALDLKVPTSRTITINGFGYNLTSDVNFTVPSGVWGGITGALSNQTDLYQTLNTKMPADRAITINGVTQSLTQDRTWTIGTAWGGITGTLANQTDLQTALNLKVPTSRSITINGVGYNLSADVNFNIGAGVWGQITGTLSNQTDLYQTLNTKVPADRTITINGVTQSLTTDRSWTISAGIGGTGTNGYVAFWNGTSNQAGDSNLFWDNTNKRLGIGTTSPSQGKLVVVGGVTNSIATISASFGTNNSLNIGDDGTNAVLGVGNSGTDMVFLKRAAGVYSEAMRITSGGNVGIGTTSPQNKLVISNGGAQGLEIGADATYNVNLAAYNRSTSAYIPFRLDASIISFGVGNVGIGTTSPSTKLFIEDYQGTSTFRINHTASTFSSTLIYGTVLATTGGYDFIGMYANGAAKFNVSSTGVVTASGGFFNSDIRLKDLVDYDYKVESIKPITYVWKDSEDKKRKIGYSAQEVQSVLPEAVKQDKEGFLSVDYIQVLVAKIAELENRIKQLEK